jgi:hypothetical protein
VACTGVSQVCGFSGTALLNIFFLARAGRLFLVAVGGLEKTPGQGRTANLETGSNYDLCLFAVSSHILTVPRFTFFSL